LLECLKKDVKRYTGLDKVRLIDIIKCYFHYKGIQAVVLFRLSNYFYKRGYKLLLNYYTIIALELQDVTLRQKLKSDVVLFYLIQMGLLLEEILL
jgi:serine acetyltransferase